MTLAADQRVRAIVDRGEVDGIFFFHGDAERLRDEAARTLVEAAVDPATRDFNLDIYRGSEVTPDSLAAALAMPPVMAPRRVVALYGAEKLTPKGCAVVESLVEKPPRDLTFVVTATIPKGSKKAFYRKLQKGALSLEWPSPRDSEIPGWLMERASERHGVGMELRAAEALAAAVGSDLGLLDAELEKLASAGPGETITVDRVAELVPNVAPVNRWAWLDTVAAREYRTALSDLPTLLASPDGNAVGLINAMVDHHVWIGMAVEGGAGLVERTLVEVGKPYLKFKARTYARQAKQWTGPEIDRALQFLRRADARAKTTASGRDRAVLEELLLKLQALSRRRGS